MRTPTTQKGRDVFTATRRPDFRLPRLAIFEIEEEMEQAVLDRLRDVLRMHGTNALVEAISSDATPQPDTQLEDLLVALDERNVQSRGDLARHERILVREHQHVLSELVRAASEYANETKGISGDLGARISDARAILADHET